MGYNKSMRKKSKKDKPIYRKTGRNVACYFGTGRF